MKIVIQFKIEGIHQWKECPLDEVGYLRDLHRHEFHIRMEKKVDHNDRDIEIIMFKRQVISGLKKNFYSDQFNCCNFGNMSCEAIAEYLMDKYNCTLVEVLEDGENGAVI